MKGTTTYVPETLSPQGSPSPLPPGRKTGTSSPFPSPSSIIPSSGVQKADHSSVEQVQHHYHHEHEIGATPSPKQVPNTFSSPLRRIPNTLDTSTYTTVYDSIVGIDQTYIYGTAIVAEEVIEKIKQFIFGFKDVSKGTGDTKYLMELKYLILSQENVLNIEASDIHKFDKNLYNMIVTYPQEVIPMLDYTVTQIANSQNKSGLGEDRKILVRLYNLISIKHMRELNPNDIDQLVSIRGMVTRVSEIIPDLKSGFFKCASCAYTESVSVLRGKIDEPSRCKGCGVDRSMMLIHNRSLFGNKQMIKLQETPESIPEGETPHTVNLCVFDDLVDAVKPGDRVDVTGIYRAVATRISPNQRRVKNIYRTYIDVIHFDKSGIRIAEHETAPWKSTDHQIEDDSFASNGNMVESEEEEVATAAYEVKISQEEEEKIKELAQSPDIYEKLTKSIATNIWEMDDVKKGILCQLFGGTHKKIPNGKIRGEINILLVGDPGVSKSQLLMHVHKIAPRGIYTSGKGSSAVGLTAYVTKDSDTGEYILESGALVLSDLGICCIDEFDKMSDATRSILHEVMEQQTVSVAKAGIICSLNARTSVLAAANPKESTYNESLSIVDNIQLPPTLLSRFDLIFLMRDIPDREKDIRLASHIISLYSTHSNVESCEIDNETLTKYISYAKKKIQPIISEEAKESLVDHYIQLRQLGSHKKQITATTRQLESLIRLSEALARMRLSKRVSKDDVEEAVRLVRSSIFKAAVDPKSGLVDIDLLLFDRNAQNLEEEANLSNE